MVQLGKVFMRDKSIELELSSMVEDHLTGEQKDKLDTLWHEMAAIIELGLIKLADDVKETINGK